MNVSFNQVDIKIIDALMKNKVVVKKRYTDKKQYLVALLHELYMEL